MTSPSPLLLVLLPLLLCLAATPLGVDADVTSSYSWNTTVELEGGVSFWNAYQLPKFENTKGGSAISLFFEVSNFVVVNGTKGEVFHVDAEQEFIHHLSGNSYSTLTSNGLGIDGEVDGDNGPKSIGSVIGPCLIPLLQNPAKDLQVQTLFRSNVTLTFNATMSYQLFDNPLQPNQSVTIPNGRSPDFFTFNPTSSSGSYDLVLSFEVTTPNVTLADRLTTVQVGCGGDQIDFSQQVAALTETFTGLSGPTYIEVTANHINQAANDVKWTLVETNAHSSKKDSGLKTWQIILIAVAGAVTVGIVALILLAIVVIVYRSKRGYQTLN